MVRKQRKEIDLLYRYYKQQRRLTTWRAIFRLTFLGNNLIERLASFTFDNDGSEWRLSSIILQIEIAIGHVKREHNPALFAVLQTLSASFPNSSSDVYGLSDRLEKLLVWENHS